MNPHGADLHQIAARRLTRSVTACYVGDLVRHHACQFGFGLGLQNQAGVHEEEAAGKSERVHFLGIEYLDGERNFRVGVADDILAYAVYVFGDYRIVNDLGLPFYFLRQLLTEGNLFFERVKINAATDVAITDCVGIFFLVVARESVKSCEV